MIIRNLPSAVLATLPAILVTYMIFCSFEDDAYYTRPWQVAAVVFLGASFLLGLKIPAWPTKESDSSSEIRWRFMVGPVLAWILAVAVVFGLSLSPMVLGQDNGDGANGYPECIFFAVSSSIVYSGLVVLVIFLNAALLSPLLRFMRTRMPSN